MTRHISRTTRRVAGLRRLIDELGKGELSRDAAAKFHQVSEAGVNICFAELVRGGIAEVARREYQGRRRLSKPIYRLIADADADKIERFLVAQGGQQAARDATAEPSSHFHIMQDDEPFPVKGHRGPVAPDPLALPAPFFSAGAGVGARP